MSNIPSVACSPTASIHKSYQYDVFLSFRGIDTRRTFVGHLYDALERNGIYTYRDDYTLEKGKPILDEHYKSIEDSKIYIIVFSKNYASSSWCLKELVKIMECQKTTEHSTYSVFYDVEPSEVRKQNGAYGEALAIHKVQQDALKWREALEAAASLAGWELKNTANGGKTSPFGTPGTKLQFSELRAVLRDVPRDASVTQVSTSRYECK